MQGKKLNKQVKELVVSKRKKTKQSSSEFFNFREKQKNSWQNEDELSIISHHKNTRIMFSILYHSSDNLQNVSMIIY